MPEVQNRSPGTRHFYRLFGLTVASDLELPEATPLGAIPPSADVEVELGAVPFSLPGGRRLGPWLEVEGQNCLLLFEGLGRFLVEHGRRIVVEKEPTASYDDLRGFLFGSGFGALVHQRGLVPLHVSAVVSPSGVIAFTGESGAGKSTIAACLNQELGWPLISDDVAVLRQTDDGFNLESGANTVKLWGDALRSLNMTNVGLRRDLARNDKFHAILSERFLSATSAPLRNLVQFSWGNDVRLDLVHGRKAYQISLAAIYRPAFAAAFSNRDRVAIAAMSVAARTSTFVLTRPKSLSAQSLVTKCLSSAFGSPAQLAGSPEL